VLGGLGCVIAALPYNRFVLFDVVFELLLALLLSDLPLELLGFQPLLQLTLDPLVPEVVDDVLLLL